MARELEVTYASGLAAGTIMPIRLVMLTFSTGVKYVWSGVGPLTWDGKTFDGVGNLGQIGAITETTGVEANGTTVSLSGIDPVLLADCLNDIQVGAPARIWRGLWNQFGGLYGTPYQVFRGYVDKPTFDISAETLAISLSLESRVVNLPAPATAVTHRPISTSNIPGIRDSTGSSRFRTSH
jgi:hypothetical protein